jgi:hypothetical protein
LAGVKDIAIVVGVVVVSVILAYMAFRFLKPTSAAAAIVAVPPGMGGVTSPSAAMAEGGSILVGEAGPEIVTVTPIETPPIVLPSPDETPEPEDEDAEDVKPLEAIKTPKAAGGD